MEAALAALERDHQVLLLTPYFGEHSPRVPGRIADYPPGVRENGGQYSHGSSWLVDALVELSDSARTSGDLELAEDLRQRAFGIWRKISPLDKTGSNSWTSMACHRISSLPTSISGQATRDAAAGPGTRVQPPGC